MNDVTLYTISGIAFAVMFAIIFFYRPHKSSEGKK